MDLKAIILLVFAVAFIGFAVYRNLPWGRIKSRSNKKQPDSSEPTEK